MLAVQADPYPFEFSPERTALLIIDMQRDFVEPGALEDGQRLDALERGVQLLWLDRVDHRKDVVEHLLDLDGVARVVLVDDAARMQ